MNHGYVGKCPFCGTKVAAFLLTGGIHDEQWAARFVRDGLIMEWIEDISNVHLSLCEHNLLSGDDPRIEKETE